MAKYQNLRSAIDFTEDEEEPILAEDDGSAVNDEANLRLSGTRLGDDVLNEKMKGLLAKTPTKAQAAAERALASMGKKQSVSEEDLLSVATPDKRKTHYSMDLREKPITGEMDLRDEAQDRPEMDLRSPRERADQNEAAFSKKDNKLSEGSLKHSAFLADQLQRLDRGIRRDKLRASEKPNYAYDPLSEKLGYQPMESGARQAAQEDAHLVSPTATEDEWDSIYKPAPASAKAVPGNEDWNTPYPDKSAKPDIEINYDNTIERGDQKWSSAKPSFMLKKDFEALPPERRKELLKTHYQGPQGNLFRFDGENPAKPYTRDEETGLLIPHRLYLGGDDTEAPTAGEVVSAGAQESQKPVVPSKGETPASTGKKEIPSALLERLRAARAADAFNEGTSSLGRLLTSTAAQYGGLKEAPALLQDYLQKNKKPSAFAEEQEFAKAEKAIRDEEEEDSTESDVALVGQNIARQLGMPEEQVKRITGKSAKILIAMLGSKTKLDLEGMKQGGNTERAKLNNATKEKIARLRSQDGKYAVDARKAMAMLRYRGGGPKSNDPKAQAKFDADVAKFVKSLPSGFGATLDNLEEIGNIIERNGGEVPGVGFFAGAMPDNLAGAVYGEDAEALRALANNIYNEYIKGNYGSAFSKTEEARFKAAMGAIKGGVNDKRFLLGLKEVSDLIGRKVEQGAAGYNDKVVETAVQRGLPTIPNSKRPQLRPPEQQASAAPVAPSDGKVTVTNGQETLRIPLSRLAEAEKDGYRRAE